MIYRYTYNKWLDYDKLDYDLINVYLMIYDKQVL